MWRPSSSSGTITAEEGEEIISERQKSSAILFSAYNPSTILSQSAYNPCKIVRSQKPSSSNCCPPLKWSRRWKDHTTTILPRANSCWTRAASPVIKMIFLRNTGAFVEKFRSSENAITGGGWGILNPCSKRKAISWTCKRHVVVSKFKLLNFPPDLVILGLTLRRP